MQTRDIYKILSTILLAVCGFFFVSFYNKVDKIDEKLTHLITRDAVYEIQILEIESRILKIETILNLENVKENNTR